MRGMFFQIIQQLSSGENLTENIYRYNVKYPTYLAAKGRYQCQIPIQWLGREDERPENQDSIRGPADNLDNKQQGRNLEPLGYNWGQIMSSLTLAIET